jgi:hypothetical protein
MNSQTQQLCTVSIRITVRNGDDLVQSLVRKHGTSAVNVEMIALALQQQISQLLNTNEDQVSIITTCTSLINYIETCL